MSEVETKDLRGFLESALIDPKGDTMRREWFNGNYTVSSEEYDARCNYLFRLHCFAKRALELLDAN